MAIQQTLENVYTNKNNHYLRLVQDQMGMRLEIGFAGDWKEKRTVHDIDISVYDMKQYRKMLDEFISAVESKDR